MGNLIYARVTAGIFGSLIIGAHLASAAVERTATTDCANSSIPREILDGNPSRPATHPMHLTRATTTTGTLLLAVAGTEPDQEAGLGCVTSLKPGTGMIYVFPDTRKWDFWEHDARIRLDYVWLDENGKVTQVIRKVATDGNGKARSGFSHRSGIGRYVLMLNAGEATANKIQEDSSISIPDLYRAAQDAPKPQPATPSPMPTAAPTTNPTPSTTPTSNPTTLPSVVSRPTATPTNRPTAQPLPVMTMKPQDKTPEPLKPSQVLSPTHDTAPQTMPSLRPMPHPTSSATPKLETHRLLEPTKRQTQASPIQHDSKGKAKRFPKATRPIGPHIGHELFPIQDHFEIRIDH